MSGPSSSHCNRAVMERQFHSDSGLLIKSTSVFLHHCNCSHPGRTQSTITNYCTNSSESASPSCLPPHFTNHLPRTPPPSSCCHHHRRQWGHSHATKAGAAAPAVQTTEPQLPLNSTMGKMKVHKVAQLPCLNLGRVGIAAEVVCTAPRREGVPAFTHQEVPNQLRRDADRLWCTFFFLFFFFPFLNPQKKMLGHSINEFVPLFQIHTKGIIPGKKKDLPMDWSWIFITDKSPSHSSCSQMTPKLSDLSKTCQAKPFSQYKMAFHCKQLFSLAAYAAC